MLARVLLLDGKRAEESWGPSNNETFNDNTEATPTCRIDSTEESRQIAKQTTRLNEATKDRLIEKEHIALISYFGGSSDGLKSKIKLLIGAVRGLNPGPLAIVFWSEKDLPKRESYR